MPRISLLEEIPFGSPEYMAASEHKHQSAFVELMDTKFREFHDIFYAIPNGGGRSRVEAISLVNEGVKAGMPDTHLPVGTFTSFDNPGIIYIGKPPEGEYRVRYMSLYLEFKDMKASSKPSDKQIDKLARLRQMGHAAFVVHGWYQAAMALDWYLGRCPPAVPLHQSGLNMAAQIVDQNYSPGSWKFPL